MQTLSPLCCQTAVYSQKFKFFPAIFNVARAEQWADNYLNINTRRYIMSRMLSTAKLILFAAIFGAMIFVGCNNSSSEDRKSVV